MIVLMIAKNTNSPINWSCQPMMGIIGKQEGNLRTESKIGGQRKLKERQLHWLVQYITYGLAHIGGA